MKKTVVNKILDDVEIYIGTYEKYNRGSLAGEWVKLGDFSSIEEFYNYCANLHSDEEDPEFMFQDFEAPEFMWGLISEGWISPDIYEIAGRLDKVDIDMIAAYIDATGETLSIEVIEQVEDRFWGYFEDDYELGLNYAESTGIIDSIPEDLRFYFDFDKLGRDLSHKFISSGGYYFS